MGRTYAVRDEKRSAHLRQLIELLKRKGCDVLRHSLDPRYTGYDVLFCRAQSSVNWHMIVVPNGSTASESMVRWLVSHDEGALVSDSITLILRWIGVEA